jgi:hypothetical protein
VYTARVTRLVPAFTANMLSSVSQLPVATNRPKFSNVAASRQVHRLVVPQAAVPGRYVRDRIVALLALILQKLTDTFCLLSGQQPIMVPAASLLQR